MVDLTSQIFLSAMGAFFLLAAVLGIVGRWKRWYWTSKRLVYIYLPIGILFLVAAVSQFFTDKTYTTVFQAVEFVLLGVGIWWVARPPDFLKPAWIRTIEARPKAIYNAMARAVKQGEEWRSKVANQEALEKWIRAIEKRSPKTPKKK